MRDFDNKVFSPLGEGDRRAGLRRLDDVLQALEELNLREAGEIPTSLKERLVDQGIPISGSSITELSTWFLAARSSTSSRSVERAAVVVA